MRRVNLLHAHGSPTRYLYSYHSCRCVACRGQRAAYYRAHPEVPAAYRAAHREEQRVLNAAYNAAHREESAASYLWRTYGLLPGEKEDLLASQGDRCAICGDDDPGSKRGWHTDHDHKTGTVRGILCHCCNLGLGGFRDNPGHLMAAVEYLAAATA